MALLLFFFSYQHSDLRKIFFYLFIFGNDVSSILKISNNQVRKERKKNEETTGQTYLQVDLNDWSKFCLQLQVCGSHLPPQKSGTGLHGRPRVQATHSCKTAPIQTLAICFPPSPFTVMCSRFSLGSILVTVSYCVECLWQCLFCTYLFICVHVSLFIS